METGYTITIAGNRTAPTGLSSDGYGLSASFWQAGGGMAITSDGSYALFADFMTCVIKRMDMQTRQVTTVLGASGLCNHQLGNGLQAHLAYPLMLLSSDNAFGIIIEQNAQTLSYLNLSTWSLSAFVGSWTGQIVDGIGMAGSFVTTGAALFAMTPDNAFIYMQENGLIRMIRIATRNLTTIAGNGTQLVVDGTGRSACVTSGSILKVDPFQRFLVIAENHVLRTMNLSTLQIITVAGQANVAGWVDGIGTAATFGGAFASLAFSPDGARLFVGIFGGGLRVIQVANWQVSHLTYADNSLGFADGAATSVLFNNPLGMAIQCGTGLTTCAGCTAGSYGTIAAATSSGICVLCQAGTYASSVVQTNCTNCTAGTYSTGVGLTSASACQSCAAGTFSYAAGASMVCGVCPSNTYAPLSGASACLTCADGTQTLDHLACVACPKNTYGPACGGTCPPNTTTNGTTGAVSLLGCACQPGFVCIYSKRIRVVITVSNTTVANFTPDALIAAIATAAGVPTTSVSVVSVSPHRRALLGIDRGRLHVQHPPPIDPSRLHFDVEGAHHMAPIPHLVATWHHTHAMRVVRSDAYAC